HPGPRTCGEDDHGCRTVLRHVWGSLCRGSLHPAPPLGFEPRPHGTKGRRAAITPRRTALPGAAGAGCNPATRLECMEILRIILVILHLLGMAIIIGGYFASIKAPKVAPGMLHGSYLQLVTGLALTGLAEAMVDEGDSVNHMKIGIKLLLAIAVTVFAIIGKRKEKAH